MFSSPTTACCTTTNTIILQHYYNTVVLLLWLTTVIMADRQKLSSVSQVKAYYEIYIEYFNQNYSATQVVPRPSPAVHPALNHLHPYTPVPWSQDDHKDPWDQVRGHLIKLCYTRTSSIPPSRSSRRLHRTPNNYCLGNGNHRFGSVQAPRLAPLPDNLRPGVQQPFPKKNVQPSNWRFGPPRNNGDLQQIKRT